MNAAFGSHQISEAGDDGFSAFGRHHAASASEEKRCFEFGFERRDLTVESRLRHAEFFGCERKGSAFNGGEEVLNFFQIHRTSAREGRGYL